MNSSFVCQFDFTKNLSFGDAQLSHENLELMSVIVHYGNIILKRVCGKISKEKCGNDMDNKTNREVTSVAVVKSI